jgi:hypothetical protein
LVRSGAKNRFVEIQFWRLFQADKLANLYSKPLSGTHFCSYTL